MHKGAARCVTYGLWPGDVERMAYFLPEPEPPAPIFW